MTKITLVSFATNDWNEALKRIDRSTGKEIFYKKIFLNQSNIEKYIPEFYKKNQYIINKYKKYPFMGNTWKIDLLEAVFKNEKDTDFFMYSDAGNEFNINKNTISRFNQYFEIANEVSFLCPINRDLEPALTHCSVIDRIYKDARKSNQRNTGTMFIKNNNTSFEIIKEWDFYIKNNNYENIMIDDNNKCCSMFNKNLYDQSVLSCVLKKNKIIGIDDEFDWYFESSRVFKSLEENAKVYPIFNARNKNFKSLMYKCVRYHDSIKHVYSCEKFKTNEICNSLTITRQK